MSPFKVRIECEDAYAGISRILDTARRMGFALDRFVVDPLPSGGHQLHVRLLDSGDDSARRTCFLHRLHGLPAVDGVGSLAGVGGEAWSMQAETYGGADVAGALGWAPAN